jgi:tetratricopeptide (TPR) repeat protein
MKSKSVNSKDRRGQTITFYSYKGGVGRSMALVNIACLAERDNKKILLVDCDLEAPGLHQFFKADAEKKGFVDLITDAIEWIKEEENNDEKGYLYFLSEQMENYIVKDVKHVIKDGKPEPTEVNLSIDLVKAGRFGKEYSQKLNNIAWMDFYKKAPAFFRTFAYYLEREYDYIFVDARTGLADTSGICTMLMPQKLVLVFALNNQNINGVIDVAGQAVDYRFSSNDHRLLDIYPLPSRIENSVNPNLQSWIDTYKEKFEKLFTEKYELPQCNLLPYFNRCFIQYYPIHAYGENIPSLSEGTESANFITYNYNNFLTILKKNIPAWEIMSPEEEIRIEKLAPEYFKKGQDYSADGKYEEAIQEYSKAIEIKPDFFDAYYARGLAKHTVSKYNEAIEDFGKVIELKPTYDAAYSGRSNSYLALEKYEEAQHDNLKAIELNPKFLKGDDKSISLAFKKQEILLFDYKHDYKHDYKSEFGDDVVYPAENTTSPEPVIKIFISSSAELKEEREKCVLLINQLNNSHSHLHLEPILWEYDMVYANIPEHKSLQSAINPKLKESNLAIFIFYSKIAQYTQEEFEHFIVEKKNLFVFFKKGFEPDLDTLEPYKVLLQFKRSLSDKVLYMEYKDISEFEKQLSLSLNQYLTATSPPPAVEADSGTTVSQSNRQLLKILGEREEEIKRLHETLRRLPNKNLQEQLRQLEKEKKVIQNELLQREEVKKQLARDKEALKQQLSQQAEKDKLKAKALEEAQRGNYTEATRYLKESAKGNINETASTFYELGKIKKSQQKATEALNYLELAVKINPENSLYLDEAGTMACELGFYDKAIDYHQRSLTVDKKFYEENHPNMAIHYNNLGIAYGTKGEYDKAFEFHGKALEIDRKFYGRAHPSIAADYNNLGSVYASKGDFDKAIAYFKKGLAIADEYYGEEHPDISQLYNNLGLAYGSEENYDKAIEYYEKALVISKKFYGEEHPNIALSYSMLGLAYRNKGEGDKAIEYINEALFIFQKFFPSGHPYIQSVQEELAAVKMELQNISASK